MKQLRKICDDNASLLIIDEVKTGFRVAKGGVQQLYGIYADLTTYAKAMGNGCGCSIWWSCGSHGQNSFGEGGVTHGGNTQQTLLAWRLLRRHSLS